MAMTDPLLVVWWGTAVECASALARLEREEALDGRDGRWSLSDAWRN